MPLSLQAGERGRHSYGLSRVHASKQGDQGSEDEHFGGDMNDMNGGGLTEDMMTKA